MGPKMAAKKRASGASGAEIVRNVSNKRVRGAGGKRLAVTAYKDCAGGWKVLGVITGFNYIGPWPVKTHHIWTLLVNYALLN